MALRRLSVPGSYLLLLALPAPVELTIGCLGRRTFAAGSYLYCGSALGGLTARLARHLRREKRPHWHIDFLLERARIVEVWVLPGRTRLECLARRSLTELGGVPVPGFGSSDCRCPGHLLFFPAPPARSDFNRALAALHPAAPAAEIWRPSPGA